MTLFSEKIYSRDIVLSFITDPVIPPNSTFQFDIGYDKKNNRNDWKKRETRPRPVLERGKDAWKANHLIMDKSKVNEISTNMKKMLNKISDKNYEKISEQIIDFEINNDPFCLNSIVKEIFEKAILEPSFSKIYASICLKLIKKYENFENINFKRLLIAHCQNFFSDRDLNNLEEYDEIIKKKKLIGNSLFIGELCNLDVLSIDLIVNKCIYDLINVDQNNKNMEMNMEIINNILIRCGNKFDSEEKVKKNLMIY